MPKNWTPEQLNAITVPGDLLVSAAAGAGKTAVLTERIARLIAEGVSVNELLVVTFTNAAAAEMKERIESRLRELAESEEDSERARALLSAAESCSRANISTLHSFCMNVLRRNYHEAGLDPAFTVAEALDAELLAKRAIDEVLEEKFSENEKRSDAGFDALLVSVGDDEKLEELIRKLHTFAVSRPDPKAWLDMAVSRYTDDFASTSKMIADSLVSVSVRELELFAARARALRVEIGDAHPGISAALDSDLSILLALDLKPDYDSWVSELPNIEFTRLNWKRGTDPDEKKGVADYREDLKNYFKKLKKRFSHTLCEEECFIRLLAPPIKALRSLADAFAARFAALKEEAGVVDFADMEQLTLTVLKNQAIADEYRSRFRYIFVDEYQDINPAQEAILKAVSRDNRFMVGDVKQSIYRFRQAEPAIFMDKYRNYRGEDGHIRIDLTHNFRSRTQVLDAVNLLFSNIMRGERVGEIDYSDNAALKSIVSGNSDGEVSLTLIDPMLGTNRYFPDETDEKSSACLEAAYAADRILRIMETETVMENGVPRRCRFSDFAVLLRSAKSVASYWVTTLSDRGIPCVTANGEGFFESIEIRLFMSLLRVIDNRRQDIPLLAVMRSPVFGFTSDDLVHIRVQAPDDDILTAVQKAAADPAMPTWSIKCRDMLKKIDEWREKCFLSELGDLVAFVLDDSRLPAYVSSLRGGSARLINLESLVSLAFRYAETGGSLNGFIRYVDESAATNEMPAQHSPGVDAVRIMTIHSSKGLEFNTVILGDIQKKFRRSYYSDTGIFDSELGVGLCSVSGDTDMKSMLQRAISAREASRLNAEEMRLLYVAMTRAKKRLIMLGIKKKAAEFAEKFARPLDDVRIMKADHYLDWILGAYFPDGLSIPARLENGGSITFGVVGRELVPGNSRGMDEEGFETWLQDAYSADTSSLKKKLRFRYPFADAAALPSKLSVTGLTLRPANTAALPRFMEDAAELTAADVGTLTHRLLKLIRIAEHTEESVRKELTRLTEEGMFTPREAGAISIPSVVKFFSSDLGRRLIASPRVEREREFELLLPANELLETKLAEPVMLQGVIDCCFLESGSWILIDHKTTRVGSRHTKRTVAERYRDQLKLYSRAITSLTGIPVREMYVYLLSEDDAVKL